MDHSNIEQYSFITISLEENIDIFKKRTENTKHQHLTIYSNHTMYIQVDPPFTLLRVIKKQIKLQYMAQFYYIL